ncbi:MAG: hypothetical protein Q8K98_12315 [Bacteroidota bacterium]|nr:hypothetical protein [Bacteroidota bacterium]
MNNIPNWSKNTDTYIWVFNVGRGLSVFVRTPNNHGMLYDLGASDEFSPIDFVEEHILPHLTKYEAGNAKQQLAQVVISHPHADHISEVEKLEKLSMGLLTCPHDKNEDEGFDFDAIDDHANLKKYRALFEKRTLPLQTIQYKSKYTTVIQAEYGIYYIRPPEVREIHSDSDHKYGNGCSILFYYKYGPNSLLIPGDMTPECFAHLLEEENGSEKRYSIFSYSSKFTNWHSETTNQPSLKDQLAEYGLTILLAPHHGLESCYSEELYEAIIGGKPRLVVISEKRHLGENDGTVDGRYQSEEGAEGMNVTIEGEAEKNRYSVTTRNGHHFLIKFGSDKTVTVFGESDPLNLLDK